MGHSAVRGEVSDRPVPTENLPVWRRPTQHRGLPRRPQVDGIHTGIYHYAPREHQLALIRSAPLEQLASEAVGWFANQPWVADACVVFLMTSVLERSMWKYRHSHAYRVVLLDAGHLGQTFHIVCTALGLGPFTSSGICESAIERALGIDGIREIPVYAGATGVCVANAH